MNRRGFLRALGLAPVAVAVAPTVRPEQTMRVTANSVETGMTLHVRPDGSSLLKFDGDRFLFSTPLRVDGAEIH